MVQPGASQPAAKGLVRKTTRETRLEAALAERDAMRTRGEVPPLPDPCGRDRRDRVLRYVAYEDARRRHALGVATAEELRYVETRRAHLSAWRRHKNARRQRRAALRAEVDSEAARHADGPASDRPFPRLRGPEDLRAFIEGGDDGE
jgi:hypothetical protein